MGGELDDHYGRQLAIEYAANAGDFDLLKRFSMQLLMSAYN